MPFPTPARFYLLKALTANPQVLQRLLSGYAAEDPIWDKKPDPERFSLREVVAHLADWDPIWTERFKRMRDEDNPTLHSIDEGEIAVLNDYSHKDPIETLKRYQAGRAELVELLATFSPEDFDRTGDREFVGPLTVQMLACLVLSHDGYHLQQALDWTAS